MKVLVGCECSGIGRDAFLARGHDAISCDLKPSERPGPHIQGDIFDAIESRTYWDLIILHPDCTALAVCGNKHYASTQERDDAIEWTASLWDCATKHSDRVCLENPASVIHPIIRADFSGFGSRPATQYVQPWQFGHPETKKTGLTKINLPDLVETNNVYEEMMKLPKKDRHKVWYASPGKDRKTDRSRSYPGIMGAMAEQWG